MTLLRRFIQFIEFGAILGFLFIAFFGLWWFYQNNTLVEPSPFFTKCSEFIANQSSPITLLGGELVNPITIIGAFGIYWELLGMICGAFCFILYLIVYALRYLKNRNVRFPEDSLEFTLNLTLCVLRINIVLLLMILFPFTASIVFLLVVLVIYFYVKKELKQICLNKQLNNSPQEGESQIKTNENAGGNVSLKLTGDIFNHPGYKTKITVGIIIVLLFLWILYNIFSVSEFLNS